MQLQALSNFGPFTIFFANFAIYVGFSPRGCPALKCDGWMCNCVCGLCGWLRHGCIRQSDLMTTILFIYPRQLTPPQRTLSMDDLIDVDFFLN